MVHSNKIGYFYSTYFDKEFQHKHLDDWGTDLKVWDEIHQCRVVKDCISEFIL